MPKSAAAIRANTKFENKAYDKITVRLRKDRLDDSGLSRDAIQAAADAEGLSINGYILKAVNYYMDRK